MTNFDVMRNGAPEEIAKLIDDASADTPPNAACCFCELNYPEGRECWECWLDWLKAEAKS